MRLEAVTAELRPRSPWESVDLGLALVRRDFWRLCAAWWLGMAPALVVAPALGCWHPVAGFAVLLWWLPVASRMELFVLSRRLFGERPGGRALLRELPRACGRRFFHRMLWARFSPWRPLSMPVEDLEGLRGKAFRARCRVLMQRGESTLSALTLWRHLLSLWLVLAWFGTVMLLLPGAVREGWNETLSLWLEGVWVAAPTGMTVALASALLGSWFLVDLYATGAGFGIYVNQRTWNEGWDVELAFRRMGERLKGVLAPVVAVALLTGGGEAGARDPQEVVEHVLADPDFTVHWEVERTPEPLDWNFGSGLGAIGEELVTVLVVLSVGALVGVLAWWLWRNRHVFGASGERGGVRVARPAQVVMGMDVRPESLPRDVAGEARRLWSEARTREALGLLYRGALSWMIGRGGVAIAEADTEGDCLRKVDRSGAGHQDYFARLTRTWQQLAYAGEMPDDRRVEELCGDWPFREGGAR